jgi:lysyl oxidase-like protein 2/3/4
VTFSQTHLVALLVPQVFAHFDITDHEGNRVAEGHKASFCLEDRECADGVDPRYDCQNYGDQVPESHS